MRGAFIYFSQSTVEIKVGLKSWKTMPRTEHEGKIIIKYRAKIRIDHINSVASSPVAEQARLDVFRVEWTF